MSKTLTGISTLNSAEFLLLNSEFRNQTDVTAFEIYGAANGTISIKVIHFIDFLIFSILYHLLVLYLKFNSVNSVN